MGFIERAANLAAAGTQVVGIECRHAIQDVCCISVLLNTGIRGYKRKLTSRKTADMWHRRRE